LRVRPSRLLLLAVLAALPTREVQAQAAVFDAEIASALKAGIVDSEVVGELRRAQRARVVVYVSRRGRAARLQADAVIERIPVAELRVGRRFERVPAFGMSHMART